MSRHTADAAKILVLSACGALALWAACIPDLSKIHLGACINECNGHSRACLGGGGAGGGAPLCPKGQACFDDVQHCSDAATACSDACDGCVAAEKCASEDVCRSACSHEANDCGKKIRGCVDAEEACARAAFDGDKNCLDVLVACVGQCASDAEAVLKGKP